MAWKSAAAWLGIELFCDSIDLAREETCYYAGAPGVVLEQSKGAQAWLAEITGTDARYGLARRFVRLDKRGLSRSGNGILVADLQPGRVYEAQSTWRSMSAQRVLFATDERGAVRVISRDEAARLVAAAA